MTRSNRENYATLENFQFTGVKAYRNKHARETAHKKFCNVCADEAKARGCNYETNYHTSIYDRGDPYNDKGKVLPVFNDSGYFDGNHTLSDDFLANKALDYPSRGWGYNGGCNGAPGDI